MGEVTLCTCLSTVVHQSSGSPARPGAGRSAHQPIHHPGRQPGGTRTCRAVRTHQQQDAQCDQPHRGHERWGLHFNSSADTARRLRAGHPTSLPPTSHRTAMLPQPHVAASQYRFSSLGVCSALQAVETEAYCGKGKRPRLLQPSDSRTPPPCPCAPPPALSLVCDDGEVGGGVGGAGEHKAIAHLGVVQEALVRLIHGA